MRSGTTWLTDLLCQHPKVALATNKKKEQWLLNRVATGEYSPQHYRDLFPEDGLLRGEWSPRYMWLLHTASAAATCIPETSPIIVCLRDPIERFASHQRYSALRRVTDGQPRWKPAISAGLGTFIGMYADQLEPWKVAVGADRIIVFTYESAARDPAAACTTVWTRLGLRSAAKLENLEQPSTMVSTGGEWAWPSGLRDTLVDLYTPQVERLQNIWGLDTSVWPNFQHIDG